jgi:putative endonuclease
MKQYNFYVYIVTNYKRTVLYTGVTNNLEQRLAEHYINRSNEETFAGKYQCYYLLFFERFQYIDKAIVREKQIKGWLRKKKEALINEENPEWKFLNEDVMEWPPLDPSLRSG